MLGGKKRKLLAEGKQAIATVTKVDYAKALGALTIERNDNYKLEITVMVRPDDGAPFEARTTGYFAQFSQPSIGSRLWVRYDPADPDRVEIDADQIARDNAAFQARAAAAAASALPPDLAANGIRGRGLLVDLTKTPSGNLVDCATTLGVRLVDGTPSYRATCRTLFAPDQAERLTPGQTIVTVRADPQNRDRIALSLSEPTPVVTISDPARVDPPARALRDGQPCRIEVLSKQRQWLATPAGDELYAAMIRVSGDGSQFEVSLPVPAGAEALLDSGELPARRLAAEPTVLNVDWAAARAEHPGLVAS